MTIITGDIVKELRARTGGGILECKKALEATNGDIELAIDLMRKSGQAKAAKKVGRIAAEGLIIIQLTPDNKTAIMLEVNSETDFVSRDDNFINFAKAISIRGLEAKANTLDQLLALPFTETSSKTIAEMRDELIAKLGENIKIRRLAFLETKSFIASYLHSDRIGVLVELMTPDAELGKNIAMHIAASRPQFITEEDIPEEEVSREKEIYLAEAIESGKPHAIAEKMMAGRLEKFFTEVTLLRQPFVKDPTITVKDLLAKVKSKVLSFTRFEVGEGIIKKHEDFAAEVEAQLKVKQIEK
jgi:elongation factor Ts